MDQVDYSPDEIVDNNCDENHDFKSPDFDSKSENNSHGERHEDGGDDNYG